MATFRYWRLKITRWNYAGSPSTGTGDVRLAELQFVTGASVKWPTAAMTDAASPSPFAVTASSDDGSRPAWRVFDENLGDTNRWISASAPGAAQWIAIDLGTPVDIQSVKIAPDGAASIGYHLLDFQLEGSTTGAFAGEETLVSAFVDVSTGWANNTLRTFSLLSVSGTVLDDTGAGAARTVRAYDRASGALLASTTSDATTGAYSISIGTTNELQIVVLDNSGGTAYEDLLKRAFGA